MKVKKWLKKFREIKDGWYNDAFPTPEILEMAEKRASICASCPLNVDNTCDGNSKLEALVDFVYQEEQRYKGRVYSGCNCPLDKKTKSPTSACPTGQWSKEA